jgi:hypothetical protein
MSIKKARRPWIFCFNPECPSKREMDASGNDAKVEERYVGQATDIKRRSIGEIEKVESN